MNTLNLKKLIDLINIYNGWSEFVQIGNCSEDFRNILLNEAYKRTYWAFISATNSLGMKDYKVFVKVLDKNKHLAYNRFQEASFVYKLCFYISEKSPYLGYVFFRIQAILRKCVSKIYNKIDWRLKWR